MRHVFILIRSLDLGGAERQVCVLAEALHRQGYQVTVGIFYAGGALEKQLWEKGVPVYALEKKGRWDLIGWFWRYLKALRQTKPDVVYSFLTTANIVAMVGRLFDKTPVVWGIRASNMNLGQYDWLARLTAWVEKKLSCFAKTIIFNSECGRQHHQALGYCLNKAVVIPNGIDTDIFSPDPKSGKMTRAHLGIPENAFVVGMLARYDPMKDYETFLTATRQLCSRHENLYFIAAGLGTDSAPWHELPSRFIRLGGWEDVPGLLNALNIMVLCSFGEGFPNVIGEAMACGIPVIASDVGDSAFIVADQGTIIPMKNPEALREAIERFMLAPPSSEAIRHRITLNFSVSQMVEKTLRVLKDAHP
jgi:glycosyltransferase involved in cell wall biosynthesis